MLRNYVLDDDGLPVHEPDVLKWGRWWETADRHIADDQAGETRVSTVFLGIDHNFSATGSPVLWETMLFGGKLDGEQERYTSRQAALAGHERWLSRAKEQP